MEEADTYAREILLPVILPTDLATLVQQDKCWDESFYGTSNHFEPFNFMFRRLRCDNTREAPVMTLKSNHSDRQIDLILSIFFSSMMYRKKSLHNTVISTKCLQYIYDPYMKLMCRLQTHVYKM